MKNNLPFPSLASGFIIAVSIIVAWLITSAMVISGWSSAILMIWHVSATSSIVTWWTPIRVRRTTVALGHVVISTSGVSFSSTVIISSSIVVSSFPSGTFKLPN